MTTRSITEKGAQLHHHQQQGPPSKPQRPHCGLQLVWGLRGRKGPCTGKSLSLLRRRQRKVESVRADFCDLFDLYDLIQSGGAAGARGKLYF